MFFLLKCFACIALVLFALDWRGVDTPARPSDKQARATPATARRPLPLDERARDLAAAGADALVAAARDRCLSAPRDCAALLQRGQSAGHAR